MLRQIDRVISGGQDGADLAGLIVAREFGISTGGTMPLGFKTLSGPHPEYADLYGVVEHTSDKYPPRTESNVRRADGTIRFAFNFESPGELCTLKAITKYRKPFFDVLLAEPTANRLSDAIAWLQEFDIHVLNVAGNANYQTEQMTEIYLRKLFTKLGYQPIERVEGI